MDSPKIIWRYVLALVGVFCLGFLLLVVLHYSFLGLLSRFDKEIANEQARIIIGHEILDNINEIERNFYMLATTSTGPRSVENLYNRSRAYFNRMERAFFVLEKGGSLTVTTRLNMEGVGDYSRVITYVPTSTQEYNFELISLKPKLIDIDKRLQTLAYLIAKRNKLLAAGKFDELDGVRTELLVFLKKSPSHFVRLRENAHRLDFKSYQNLSRLKDEVKLKNTYYEQVATVCIVVIFIGVLVISLLIARQIFGVHSELDFVRQEMEKARREAETANKIKSDFLSTMSHEVRTPMNIIIGMTGLLLETKLSSSQQRYANRISNAAEILLGLIDDILDFSSIDGGKLELVEKPFDLGELINSVVEVVKNEAWKKGIRVRAEVEPSPWAPQGDGLRMRQVLLIIVRNAVKFTEKGEVVVHAALQQLDSSRLLAVVQVRDTGIGIAREQLTTIFDTFAQGDASVTRKYGGTGLGLAISNQLVKLMGGEINVESEEGKGSVFTLSLPFAKSAHGQSKTATMQNWSLAAELPSPLEILLVEEDDDQQEVARGMLEKIGHRVKVVPGCLEALQAMAKFQYDLVFLPFQGSDSGGMKTAEDIRAFERGEEVKRSELGYDLDWLAARLNGQHTYLVAVTDHPALEGQLNEISSLFDNHLCKPYGTSSLIQLVSGVREGRQQ